MSLKAWHILAIRRGLLPLGHCLLVPCKPQLVLLRLPDVCVCLCLEDGAGLSLFLELLRCLCGLLPCDDGLDTVHLQGGLP
ncbi:hypothetical protein E2562_027567 [Oryza meyeriana var. granulata]|uniref:DUF3778 domain-containing protein n=1 Tax=Oryza meyeriana var. granulata TaxID=110450 RepID=A0A6G1EZK0_9ORYZ|nr:hypothetical protein E2562_027567 [Oryza meyeriana var. granulata]